MAIYLYIYPKFPISHLHLIYTREAYLNGNAKKKQAILKMLGSNFSYKDKKVSVELTSVFNYLINNDFVNYGARDEARTRDPFLGKEVFYH